MGTMHGGDWAGYQREYGSLPLDFSANLNPLGMPEGARRAAATAAETADRYPDPYCFRLRQSLSACHHIPAEQIVCGNGAADLIFRLPLALKPKTALLPVPVFTEYETALRGAGCEVRRFPLSEENDFALTEAILPHIVPGLDLLILCNPNNPTGRTAEASLLRQILERCRETGTRLVVDECFIEMLDRPEKHSLVSRLSEETDLILIRAFTKSFSMAGLRLGYAFCGDAVTAARLQNCGQAWAVSEPAQAAGLAALRETAYLDQVRALLEIERPFLTEGLKELGCRCLQGEANFILFYSEETALCEKLRQRGILLRDCRDFEGLQPGWYRCAIRTHEENVLFLKAMEGVLVHG